MKAKKPERNIGGMGVLKDIRGLLSTTAEVTTATGAGAGTEDSLRVEAARLQEEVASYKELVQKQQEELRRLETQNNELKARLSQVNSGKDKVLPSAPSGQELRDEIAQLEERIAN